MDLVENKLPLWRLANKYDRSTTSLVHHRDHHLMPALVLQCLEARPGAVPAQVRVAAEHLAQAASASGLKGVSAAYYLLNLITLAVENPRRQKSPFRPNGPLSSPGRSTE